MKKERYSTPEMEIVTFDAEDVITASNQPGISEGEVDMPGLGVNP